MQEYSERKVKNKKKERQSTQNCIEKEQETANKRKSKKRKGKREGIKTRKNENNKEGR